MAGQGAGTGKPGEEMRMKKLLLVVLAAAALFAPAARAEYTTRPVTLV